MTKFLAALFLLISVQVFADPSNPDGMIDPNLVPDEMSYEQVMPDEPLENVLTLEQEIFSVEGFDVLKEFPVVIRISKAANGQKMWVWQYGVQTQIFPVSTGREQWEIAKSGRRYFTGTPVGWYKPQALIRKHWSNTWEAYMEFSVFFVGGVAMHATTPDHYPQLGTRASGGCVRLHKTNAQFIFELVSSQGQGLVPVINRAGQVARDRNGNIIRRVGWNTVIIVEDI
jgi:hypothetical protein